MGAILIVLGTGEEIFQKALSAARTSIPGLLDSRSPMMNRWPQDLCRERHVPYPFRYEPCGLTQMYSLRYGTVPVVRATGGLDDTIQEYDPAMETGNGFKFEDYTSGLSFPPSGRP